MRFEFDDREFQARMVKIPDNVDHELIQAMHDTVDDLVRISSAIAPIDTGTLRRSAKGEVAGGIGEPIIGEVSFSAIAKSKGYGRFNYAYWTHEMSYNLGPHSAASSGTDGYSVGNKYLTRPLYGEARKYAQWFAEATMRGLGR